MSKKKFKHLNSLQLKNPFIVLEVTENHSQLPFAVEEEVVSQT